MKTKLWAIAIMVLTTFLTTTAQIFYKKGADILVFDFMHVFTNYYLFIGVMVYAIGAGLMIMAFKGGELSVLYPIIATSYIWVAISSSILFNDTLNMYRWLGIFAIFFGVVFIGIGSKQGAAI